METYEQIENYNCQIRALKQALEMSDYKAIKYAEGAISEEEYAEAKNIRASYRAQINKLEAEIAELQATLPQVDDEEWKKWIINE
jgi:chromosome segregation ATPase